MDRRPAVTRRETFRQRRLDATRTFLDCGAPLPADRRGFYCEAHGRDESPIAWCAVRWDGDYWAVVVERCPLCSRRHHHGGGADAAPDLGHRQSHCLDRFGSYDLVETAASRIARDRGAA
jgi:hypothetical protein